MNCIVFGTVQNLSGMQASLKSLLIRRSYVPLKAVRSSSLIRHSKKNITKAMESPQDWLHQDERRMLHAVYRVGNMDEYIKYMQDCFGMKLLRYRDIKEEKYTNAFLGYGSELTNFCLEYVENGFTFKYCGVNVGMINLSFLRIHPNVRHGCHANEWSDPKRGC